MPPFEEDVAEIEQESSAAPNGVSTDTLSDADEGEGNAATPAADDELDDTRSIVRDVVQGSADAEASSAEGDDEEDKPSGEVEDDEDFSKVPFAAHPRFQQVLAQRREFKADALEYRKLRTFIDEGGVSGEEAGAALEIAVLRRVDPVACFERLKPWIQQLAIDAGEILPQDLAQQVQAGTLDRDTAFLVSRERAKARSTQSKADHDRKRGEAREQTRQRDQLQGAARDWERQRRLRDPNFAKKLPSMRKELLWLQKTEGHPNTPDGVKAQLKKAYDNVSAVYKQTEDMKQRNAQRGQRPTASAAAPASAKAAQQAQPGRKPAVTPVIGGQVNGNAQVPASSTLDIVQANRRQRGA